MHSFKSAPKVSPAQKGEALRRKIEDSNLDLIQAMGERWQLEFPSGKIPDHLVTEAFDVTKSFWSELSKTRKGT